MQRTYIKGENINRLWHETNEKGKTTEIIEENGRIIKTLENPAENPISLLEREIRNIFQMF
tara:strand:+ start:474 stop:656 length:183 start_codon:yes stop_codon:yes gene_type:complete